MKKTGIIIIVIFSALIALAVCLKIYRAGRNNEQTETSQPATPTATAAVMQTATPAPTSAPTSAPTPAPTATPTPNVTSTIAATATAAPTPTAAVVPTPTPIVLTGAYDFPKFSGIGICRESAMVDNQARDFTEAGTYLSHDNIGVSQTVDLGAVLMSNYSTETTITLTGYFVTDRTITEMVTYVNDKSWSQKIYATKTDVILNGDGENAANVYYFSVEQTISEKILDKCQIKLTVVYTDSEIPEELWCVYVHRCLNAQDMDYDFGFKISDCYICDKDGLKLTSEFNDQLFAEKDNLTKSFEDIAKSYFATESEVYFAAECSYSYDTNVVKNAKFSIISRPRTVDYGNVFSASLDSSQSIVCKTEDTSDGITTVKFKIVCCLERKGQSINVMVGWGHAVYEAQYALASHSYQFSVFSLAIVDDDVRVLRQDAFSYTYESPYEYREDGTYKYTADINPTNVTADGNHFAIDVQYGTTPSDALKTLPQSVNIVCGNDVVDVPIMWDIGDGWDNSFYGTVVVKGTLDESVCSRYGINGDLFKYEAKITVSPYNFMWSNDGIEEYYAISKYNGTDENIVVPSMFNGLPVKCILKGAFTNCKNLNNVVVPSTFVYIYDSAFINCTALETVTIPDFFMKNNTYYGYIFGCDSKDDVSGFTKNAPNLHMLRIVASTNSGKEDYHASTFDQNQSIPENLTVIVDESSMAVNASSGDDEKTYVRDSAIYNIELYTENLETINCSLSALETNSDYYKYIANDDETAVVSKKDESTISIGEEYRDYFKLNENGLYCMKISKVHIEK